MLGARPVPQNLLHVFPQQRAFKGAFQRRASFVSYNPLHARHPARLDTILQELAGCRVVALQGTRRPQADLANLLHTRDFFVVDSGYAKGGNTHTGVILAFNRHTTALHNLQSYYVPTNRMLHGRLLGVREKCSNVDYFHVSCYFPPSTSSGSLTIVQQLF